VLVVVDVPEAVLDDPVGDGAVAEVVTLPGFLEVVGHVGHALHAAGHHDITVAEHDRLGRERDGLHPRRADLVDGRALGRVGDSCKISQRKKARSLFSMREEVCMHEDVCASND